MNRTAAALLLGAGLLQTVCAAPTENVRTIRLIQDDAQDYMVSKIFELKYLMANDVTPFVLGIVKRYNHLSTVTRINYKAGKQQLLAVSCPVRMMPYVDEMIRLLDRPSRIAGKAPGDPIRGTGSTRAVYPAKFRAAQVMVDIMTGSGINSGKDSYVGYDPTTNLIYWKDDLNKSDDMLKYLAWLDRPIPMANLSFTVYEMRDSTLRDLGIDYLGWRNGPGLNLFQAGMDALSLSSGGSSAVNAASGAFGGFFFAPQFDASFIRILQQDGLANIANTASLTVANSDSAVYSIGFHPESQAIFKRDNDQLQVGVSGLGMQGGVKPPESSTGAENPLLTGSAPPPPLALSVTAPRICFRGEADAGTGQVPYRLSDYNTTVNALVTFNYKIQVADVVERNNYGAELAEIDQLSGDCNLLSGEEKILTMWHKESEVEQTIGVPFLSEIPILKHLFSTTTVNREKTWYFVTIRTVLAHPESLPPAYGGQLQAFESISPAAAAVSSNQL